MQVPKHSRGHAAPLAHPQSPTRCTRHRVLHPTQCSPRAPKSHTGLRETAITPQRPHAPCIRPHAHSSRRRRSPIPSPPPRRLPTSTPALHLSPLPVLAQFGLVWCYTRSVLAQFSLSSVWCCTRSVRFGLTWAGIPNPRLRLRLPAPPTCSGRWPVPPPPPAPARDWARPRRRRTRPQCQRAAAGRTPVGGVCVCVCGRACAWRGVCGVCRGVERVWSVFGACAVGRVAWRVARSAAFGARQVAVGVGWLGGHGQGIVGQGEKFRALGHGKRKLEAPERPWRHLCPHPHPGGRTRMADGLPRSWRGQRGWLDSACTNSASGSSYKCSYTVTDADGAASPEWELEAPPPPPPAAA